MFECQFNQGPGAGHDLIPLVIQVKEHLSCLYQSVGLIADQIEAWRFNVPSPGAAALCAL